MMVLWLSSTLKSVVEFTLIWRSGSGRLVDTSCLGLTLEICSFICLVHERFHCCVCFIKVLLCFLLTNAIFKAAYLVEFAYCAAVKFIHAFECLLP